MPPLLADLPAPGAAPRAPLPATALTRRQRDVPELIVDGRSNREIARALELGEGTVKVHVAALLRALGVADRAGAAAIGARVLGRG